MQKGAPSAPPAIPSPLRARLVPLHGMGEHEHNRSMPPSSSFYFSSSSSPKARLWKRPAAEAVPELHVGSGQRAPWHRAVGITPAARGGVEPQFLAQLSARLMRPRSEPSAPSCPLPLGTKKGRAGERATCPGISHKIYPVTVLCLSPKTLQRPVYGAAGTPSPELWGLRAP